MRQRKWTHKTVDGFTQYTQQDHPIGFRRKGAKGPYTIVRVSTGAAEIEQPYRTFREARAAAGAINAKMASCSRSHKAPG